MNPTVMLEENNHLIQSIVDYHAKGRANEASQIQQILHRNLVYLATLADSNHSSMQQLLQNPSQPGGVPPMANNVGAPSTGPQGLAPGPERHAAPNISQVPTNQPAAHSNPNIPNQADGMPPASMASQTPTSDTNTGSHQVGTGPHQGGTGPTNTQAPNAGSYKGVPQQGDNANMPPGQTVSSANNSTPSTNMPTYSESPSNMSGNYYSHQNPQMQQGSMMAPHAQAQPMQQSSMPNQAPTSQYPSYPQQGMNPQQPITQSSPMQATPASMMQPNTPNQQPALSSGYRPQSMQGQGPYSQQPTPQSGYNPQFPGNQQPYMPNQQMPRHNYPGNMSAPATNQYPQGASYGTPGPPGRNYNFTQGPQQPQGQPGGPGFGGYNQNAFRGGFQQ